MTTYSIELIAIPLGLRSTKLKDGIAREEFPVSIVSNISVLGPYARTELCAAIDVNPAWNESVNELTFTLSRQRDGLSTSGTLRRRWGKNEVPEWRERLKSYLIGTSSACADPVLREAHTAKHDARFDKLRPSRVFDAQSIYQRSIPERDFVAYAMNLELTKALNDDRSKYASDIHARYLRAATTMIIKEAVAAVAGSGQATLASRGRLDELAIKLGLMKRGGDKSLFAENFREDFQQLVNRVNGYDAKNAMLEPDDDPSVPEEHLARLMKGRDPNALIHAAIKDPVLARALGLVTDWTASIQLGEVIPNAIYELTIALGASISSDLAVATAPTVMRMGPEVCPAPKAPDLAHTGAFAWLNDRPDGHDYRALQVSADGELIKGWVLQNANTLASSDLVQDPRANIKEPETPKNAIEPPKLSDPRTKIRQKEEIRGDKASLLRQDAAGLNQPETKGITFSASPTDLARGTPGEHDATSRKAAERYYLEDLWTGYRIDIAESDRGGTFRSLHEEVVSISPKGLDWTISDEGESYFDREQMTVDRPTGTEITTWTGIAAGQRYPIAPGARQIDQRLPSVDEGTGNQNYAEKLSYDHGNVVDRIATTTPGSLPRLNYPSSYEYRIRNVFCGGVSINRADADELLKDNTLHRRHIQSFRFLRSAAYSPGELLRPNLRADSDRKANENEQTYYLLGRRDRKSFYLVPRPLGHDELRFGGYIGVDPLEPSRFRRVAQTENVRALMLDDEGQLSDRIYFCDKDVGGVVMRAESLTSNPDEAPVNRVVQGVECEALMPWRAATLQLGYGERGRWEAYRPIQVELVATGSKSFAKGTKHNVRREGAKCVIEVPPGDVVELSIVPDVGPEDVHNSYFYLNALRGGTSAGWAIKTLSPTDTLAMFPIIVERRVLVVHATRRPRRKPVLSIDARFLVRQSTESTSRVFIAPRGTSSIAYVLGTLRVDAPSTGEVVLEAKWREIRDVPTRLKYDVVDGAYTAPPRSIFFGSRSEHEDRDAFDALLGSPNISEGARELHRFSGEQCLENYVHLLLPVASKASACNAIEFKSEARRIATVTVRALSRYRHLYQGGLDSDYERRSRPVTIDAPNQIVPPAVVIAHVLPTFPASEGNQPAGPNNQGVIGLRCFVERPWFLTGVGERCAVGCLFRHADTVEEYAIAKKYGSLWGEDPFELPRLDATRRIPRASDFAGAPGDDGSDLDPELYPMHDPSEHVVLSFFDVPIAIDVENEMAGNSAAPSKPAPRLLSLASYALRFDSDALLYYFDITVRGHFFGWMRLALYRHQPHAKPGCEISTTATHVYAAILQNDTLVDYDADGWRVIRIGPCFDRTISYSAATGIELAPGVVQGDDSEVLVFGEHVVERARYFVLRTNLSTRGKLTIYRMREKNIQSAFRA